MSLSTLFAELDDAVSMAKVRTQRYADGRAPRAIVEKALLELEAPVVCLIHKALCP